MQHDPAQEKAGGTQRLKGEHGDMDMKEMLEKLDAQAQQEEDKKEGVQQRREDAEERRREKAAFDVQKKGERDAWLALERPITNLLQQLMFVGENAEEVGSGELSAFARANRGLLVQLGVDASQLTKKHLMPQLTNKVSGVDPALWQRAPPKALPAPANVLAAAPLPGSALGVLSALSAPAMPPLQPPITAATHDEQLTKRSRAE